MQLVVRALFYAVAVRRNERKNVRVALLSRGALSVVGKTRCV